MTSSNKEQSVEPQSKPKIIRKWLSRIKLTFRQYLILGARLLCGKHHVWRNKPEDFRPQQIGIVTSGIGFDTEMLFFSRFG